MGKYSKSFYASVARTATPAAVSVEDDYVFGIQVSIVVSAAAATPSVVPTIDGYDPLSDTWYNLLTGAALTGTGTTILRVHPDLTAVTNLTSQDFLPKKYRLVMTHADTDSITYTVNVNSTT
tara:strand:- start:253 stop:618 length:366 start_codon:yes stop_codon:yes gene_type:complete